MGDAAPTANGLSVRECEGYGVHLLEAAGGTFTGTEIVDGGRAAIYAAGTASTTFESTTISGAGTGVGVCTSDSAAPRFATLTVTGTENAAIRAASSGPFTVSSARLESAGQDGVLVAEGGVISVEDIDVSGAGGAGLYVESGGRLECRSARFTGGRDSAIVVDHGSATLTDCFADGGNASGVMVTADSHVRLTSVEVRQFTAGIVWMPGATGSAVDCTSSDNSQDGIVVQTDEPVELRSCRVIGNGGAGVAVEAEAPSLTVIDLSSRDNGRPDDAVANDVGSSDSSPEPAERRDAGPAATEPVIQSSGDSDGEEPPATDGAPVPLASSKRPGRLQKMLSELDALIGLAEVKVAVRRLIAVHLLNCRTRAAPACPRRARACTSSSPATRAPARPRSPGSSAGCTAASAWSARASSSRSRGPISSRATSARPRSRSRPRSSGRSVACCSSTRPTRCAGGQRRDSAPRRSRRWSS